MKVENLPRVITVNKDHICFNCKGKIKKKTLAIYSWWVFKKSTAYTHIKCG